MMKLTHAVRMTVCEHEQSDILLITTIKKEIIKS